MPRDDGFKPNSNRLPARIPHAPVAGPGTTHESREIARKFNTNIQEEQATTIQAGYVGEMVKTLNKDLMVDGAELIEFATDLKNQDRDPQAQVAVNKFLNHVQSKALNDQIATTDIGIQGLHSIERRPLTPDAKKKSGWNPFGN